MRDYIRRNWRFYLISVSVLAASLFAGISFWAMIFLAVVLGLSSGIIEHAIADVRAFRKTADGYLAIAVEQFPDVPMTMRTDYWRNYIEITVHVDE